MPLGKSNIKSKNGCHAVQVIWHFLVTSMKYCTSDNKTTVFKSCLGYKLSELSSMNMKQTAHLLSVPLYRIPFRFVH